jgi:hypothetical protein
MHTAEEREYSAPMSHVRIAVEWAFGQIKGDFPYVGAQCTQRCSSLEWPPCSKSVALRHTYLWDLIILLLYIIYNILL